MGDFEEDDWKYYNKGYSNGLDIAKDIVEIMPDIGESFPDWFIKARKCEPEFCRIDVPKGVMSDLSIVKDFYLFYCDRSHRDWMYSYYRDRYPKNCSDSESKDYENGLYSGFLEEWNLKYSKSIDLSIKKDFQY